MATDDRLIDGCTYRAAIIRDESRGGGRELTRGTTELKTRSICVTEIMSSTRNGSPPDNVQENETKRNETKQNEMKRNNNNNKNEINFNIFAPCAIKTEVRQQKPAPELYNENQPKADFQRETTTTAAAAQRNP